MVVCLKSLGVCGIKQCAQKIVICIILWILSKSLAWPFIIWLLATFPAASFMVILPP